MNAQEREAYLCLTRITLPPPRFANKDTDEPWGQWNVGLCHFCRYAEWEGSACSDSELNCRQGLERIAENADDVWCGGDCWAFRAAWLQEDCVDAVGLMLNGWYPDFSSCRKAHLTRKKKVKQLQLH